MRWRDALRVRRGLQDPPALAQTAYLVEAAAASQAAAPRRADGRVLWVAELFVALSERERLPRPRLTA